MTRFVLRRLLSAIPVLLIVSFSIFVLIDLVPGDPARNLAGENPTEEQIAEVRELLRLDDPLVTRYVTWVGDTVSGDLGQSFVNGQAVSSVIASRVWVTLSLVAVALLFTLSLGPILGMLAARRPGGIVDRAVTVAASVAIAMPPFWVALILVLFFAINRSWLPAVGFTPLTAGFSEWIRHLWLPALSLSLLPAAEVAMQLRTSLADVLTRDFILNVEAKGMSSRSVLVKHASKNAAVPVVTVFGYRFGQMMGGTVTIETVFSMHGIGTLAVVSVLGRDIPVLLGLVVLTTALVLLVNLLVDISYGYFNPKIRA